MKNLYEYIAKNMPASFGEFSVCVTDVSDMEPDMLLLSIQPIDRPDLTANFLMHVDGREEKTVHNAKGLI